MRTLQVSLRIGLLAIAFFSGAAWSAVLRPPGEVTIELPAKIQVRGGEVSLDDIAVMTARDVATMRRLMVVSLGRAPFPGSSVVLERELLARWVTSRTGLPASRITWKGATETEVATFGALTVTGEEVVKVARAAIEAHLAPSYRRLEIQSLSVPRDLLLPAGNAVLKARPLSETQARKRMLVWVDAFVDDRFVRAIPVSFEVGAFARVAVSLGDAKTGQVLDSRSLAEREVDVTLAQKTAGKPADDIQADQQRLRRSLRAGEVLTTRDIEALPEVSRGNWAVLRAGDGLVALETRVEVLQDGRMGQIVRVKQANATASLLARVVGPGLVEIK